MYVSRAFPPGEDGETRVRGFDLAATLTAGETIASVTSSLVCVSGADPDLAVYPTARFIGSPGFSGTQISQTLSFNDAADTLAGNVYVITLAATTSLSQVIAPWTQLPLAIGYGYPSAPMMSPPATAEIIILPTPAPKFVLPALGGYAGEDFPTIDQGETRFMGFDVSSALSPTETITATNTFFSLTLLSGADPTIPGNSMAYFSGSPVISGGAVTQLVAWPAPLPDLRGNVYVLAMTARSSFNQQITAWAKVNIGVMIREPLG